MIFVLLAALALGVVCYFGMDALGTEAIDHWYLSDDAVAARNLEHERRLQEYVSAHGVSSRDTLAIEQWSRGEKKANVIVYQAEGNPYEAGSWGTSELLDDSAPDFDPQLDPKCCWALRHPEFFPVEVNRADYEALLRVPGIGVVSAKRILVARRSGALRAEDLKKLGVVMKRAQYFLTCGGRYASPLKLSQEGILQNLMAVERRALPQAEAQQLSLFDQVG